MKNFEVSNNERLYDRNIKAPTRHNDIDRLFVEREFNQNSKDDKQGEITGNGMDNDEYDKGMPMRSQYTIRKPMYDPNKYLDFDLFEDKPTHNNKIQYDDPTLDYADIKTSMTSLTSQTNPLTICSTQIEKLGGQLFKFLNNTLNDNYIIITIGLYNIFSCLYLASSDITEQDLKKCFNYPKKSLLTEGMHKINTHMDSISNMIQIKNLLIVGNDVPYNPNFLKSISKYCMFMRVDIKETIREASKINYLINQLMKTNMRTPIKASNMDNLQLMFMTTALIHPIWTYAFSKTTQGIFYGIRERKENYLHSIGKSFNYFEDNLHQLVEIKCGNGHLVFGVLLHKNETENIVQDNEKLQFYISNLKECLLDEIVIPMFVQDLKLRYNNTLKSIGLHSIFYKITSEELFPEGCILHDVIQNVKIIIDTSSMKNTDNTKGNRSNRKFIANKPFIYYFRLPKSNTIIINGKYF